MTRKTNLAAWGRLRDRQDEQEQRRQALEGPGAYHGDIAASELHWCTDQGHWLSRDPASGEWHGYDGGTGEPLVSGLPEPGWRPWREGFDASDAPFYRWFVGARTNACFNEVDRHVLSGRGSRAAFIFEGDRWDPSRNEGRGGPVAELTIPYRRLLFEAVVRAEVLSGLGLGNGDRVAFNLPNIPEQLFYTAAAKRLGIIYTPVFGGFSAKTLSDRIADAGARVVVTADGGYRNAEIVPYKESFTDQALDNFIPRPAALDALQSVLAEHAEPDVGDRLSTAVRDALAGEITLERSDIMRELGRALGRESGIAAEQSAEIRTAVARRLADVTHIVERVIVVRYTGQDIVEQPRDRWSHDLVATATARVLDRARAAGFDVPDEAALLALDDRSLWQALNASHPAPARRCGLAAVRDLHVRFDRQAEGRRPYARRLAGRYCAHDAHGLRRG